MIGRGVDRQRINQDLVYRSKGGELEDHESLKCRLPSVFNLANHAGDIKAPIRFALFGQPFQPDINPPGVSIPEGEPVLDIFFSAHIVHGVFHRDYGVDESTHEPSHGILLIFESLWNKVPTGDIGILRVCFFPGCEPFGMILLGGVSIVRGSWENGGSQKLFGIVLLHFLEGKTDHLGHCFHFLPLCRLPIPVADVIEVNSIQVRVQGW